MRRDEVERVKRLRIKLKQSMVECYNCPQGEV